MRIEEWDERYRNRDRAEDWDTTPTRLLVAAASKLTPGRALDLACGAGRNAIWLAGHGWNVTAVDGSRAAIDALNERANQRGLQIQTRAADLDNPNFAIERNAWDLIAKCYYLQRSLLPAVREGVRPGGTVVVIVHLANPGDEVTYKQAAPGELQAFFKDWQILHYFEGQPSDPPHKRLVAELVARKPTSPN